MWILLAALALAAPALPPERTVTWELTVGGRPIGTRNATVRYEVQRGKTVRVIESWTDLAGAVGPVNFTWKQRLTAVAGRTPASFSSVVQENGSPSEVQGRWEPQGWVVTTVDRRQVNTRDVPGQYIDLSTADLMDPGSRYTLLRYDHVKLLSAETGDIWDGAVESLGPAEITIDGKVVPVEGAAWMSPEGRTEFWYNDEGYLVRYRMRLLGFEVQGLLTDAPPPGADEFAVPISSPQVNVRDL